jgi:hypothetical protein
LTSNCCAFFHEYNIINQHTYNQSADACDISPIAPKDTNTLRNINFTPAFLPTTSTCITDSDAETQMPDNLLYNGLSDDESLNENAGVKLILCNVLVSFGAIGDISQASADWL